MNHYDTLWYIIGFRVLLQAAVLGVMLGPKEGALDRGAEDGTMLGVALGFALGLALGFVEGISLGFFVGSVEEILHPESDFK